MVEKTDVVIIGSGPVGLFAIFECGMLKLKTHVFDALDTIGGQCKALYPQKPIYDIPAHPSINGGELIDNLEAQAKPFSPVFHMEEQITSIEQLDGEGKSWRVTGSKGSVVECQSIIIAAGVGAFGPNRPPLEGIELYEKSKAVRYFIPEVNELKGKRVVIAGGGDSAVDWALTLQGIAKSIHVVHRRDKFRAAPDSVEKMNALAAEGNITKTIPYQLSALKGNGSELSHVVVEDLEGNKVDIEADVLLPFFGLSMNLGPINDWSVDLENKHIVVEPSTMQTNRPGIYAIGDVATYKNKQKLILTGFAEGAQAAHAIRSFLYPDEVRHFEYSTTQGVPGK